MGGFLGIGGSGAKTDRSAVLGARGNLQSIFNYGLPAGEAQQASGTGTLQGALSTLQPAASYWRSLLAPGRTTATQMAAPAINTALDQADAARRQAGAFGTGRTGGATAIQREAGATTEKSIDDLINEGLMTGRAAGAQGLTQTAGAQAEIGSAQLADALRLLGLSESSVQDVLSNAQQSYQYLRNQSSGVGQLLGGLAGSFLGPIGTAAGSKLGGMITGAGGGGSGDILTGDINV